MDGAPVVSVVITCHNHGRFLRDAVESVRRQTFREFEVIVVDDGSVDETPAVTASLDGIHCVRQTNQGLSAARNAGWQVSRGLYLVFLDADDRLLPRALQCGLEAAVAHPEAAFVSGHYAMINADGVRTGIRHRPCVTSDHYAALLRSNYIGMHATVVYRRDTLSRFGGFDPSLSACEDYDVFLRVARQAPIACHHELVAEYRWHGGNMSRNNTLMLGSALNVLRRQRPYIRGQRSYEVAYRAGVVFWQRLFGEALLDDIVERLRGGASWATTLRMVAVVLRYHPRGVARRAALVAWRLARSGGHR